MEKKQTEIGKNLSSGAEKVETVASKPSAQNTKKKTVKKPPQAKIAGEKARAKKRVDEALKREERKAKRAELKEMRKAKREEAKRERQKLRDKMKEERQKRMEQARQKAAERRAEREARRELLKNETKKERAKRREKEREAKQKLREEEKARAYQLKLERRDARLKKREQRLKDRAHRRENRRTPGFGGWLAAVISLGAVSLVLTSIVTYGALNMRTTDLLMQTGYRSTMYELIGIMDDVDEDLSKVRVSASNGEQARLLTDLLVQTRLAESNLEKMPISAQDEMNTTEFLNKTARAASIMLEKLRVGGTLNEKDIELLERLYATNHQVRAVLDELAQKMTDKDWKNCLKNKKNVVNNSFAELENLTVPEGDIKQPPFEVPTREGEEKARIASGEAEGLCREYFKEYSIKKVEYAGETISRKIDAYNFFLYDENGVKIFAEISKSGELLGFDYYKNCKTRNFDFDRAKAIAEDYLQKQGYQDMTAVWSSESGAEVDFKFVYAQNGAVYYPDAVNVKVCLERGVVSGLDATAYIRNHKGRSAPNVKLTENQAEEKLHDKLNVLDSRLCVINEKGREIAAYEFVCEYDGTEFYIYLDAQTGEETHIFIVENSMQGRILR